MGQMIYVVFEAADHSHQEWIESFHATRELAEQHMLWLQHRDFNGENSHSYRVAEKQLISSTGELANYAWRTYVWDGVDELPF